MVENTERNWALAKCISQQNFKGDDAKGAKSQTEALLEYNQNCTSSKSKDLLEIKFRPIFAANCRTVSSDEEAFIHKKSNTDGWCSRNS